MVARYLATQLPPGGMSLAVSPPGPSHWGLGRELRSEAMTNDNGRPDCNPHLLGANTWGMGQPERPGKCYSPPAISAIYHDHDQGLAAQCVTRAHTQTHRAVFFQIGLIVLLYILTVSGILTA